MYECDVWNFPPNLLGWRFRRNWAERIEFINQSLSRHHILVSGGVIKLNSFQAPTDLYRAFGELKGASLSGEKSPFYSYRMVQLHKEYPKAYFIFVWRNPLEVYRSVLKAGKTSRKFRQRGILKRLIFGQEQAIRQAEKIEKNGARLFRVNYADMVDQSEKVCRDICSFLGVPYDPQMLELRKADLSAVYDAPHHAHLRRGIIERQEYRQELVPPRIARKLDRYKQRWERLQAKWLNLPAGTAKAEPGPFEFACDNITGQALINYDAWVRAGFEFIPLPWLRVYRLLKKWVHNAPEGIPEEETSMFKDFRQHSLTILTATLILVLVAYIHHLSNPHLLFILFYGSPCALLALVVNNRWATLFVLLSAFLAPVIQYEGDSDYRSIGVFAWNFITRFILLEGFILTLSRIRREFVNSDEKVD